MTRLEDLAEKINRNLYSSEDERENILEVLRTESEDLHPGRFDPNKETPEERKGE